MHETSRDGTIPGVNLACSTSVYLEGREHMVLTKVADPDLAVARTHDYWIRAAHANASYGEWGGNV